uniref:NADAR domain-containing protein n=1 Tax=Tetranychus urticae TaxID=32264 RepID=T1JXY1_TETUR
MASLDISSLFFTRDLLNIYYEQLDIDHNARKKIIKFADPLDYAYQSPNQITTIKTEDDSFDQCVLTYKSAQNYYQSEKVRILRGPEEAEKVRLSDEPFQDGFVPIEEYNMKRDKWRAYKYDVAFKCNWLKFTQNKELARALLDTGRSRIVSRRRAEWSRTNSKFLMIIREDLRRRGVD